MVAVYEMSIEPVDGVTFRNGSHLGTDEKIARSFVVERFHGRNYAGMATRTIALWFDGKMIDVYDGQWSSDQGFED